MKGSELRSMKWSNKSVWFCDRCALVTIVNETYLICFCIAYIGQRKIMAIIGIIIYAAAILCRFTHGYPNYNKVNMKYFLDLRFIFPRPFVFPAPKRKHSKSIDLVTLAIFFTRLTSRSQFIEYIENAILCRMLQKKKKKPTKSHHFINWYSHLPPILLSFLMVLMNS